MVCQTISTLVTDHDDLPLAGRQPVAVALGMVNLVSGIHELEMPLAGITVAETELALRDILNLADRLETYVDGWLVAWGYRLRAGERLEFVRVRGRKGAGRSEQPVDPRQPIDPRHQSNQLFWEVLQEIRELNNNLGRIADYFDPPTRKQPDVTAAIKALENKLDRITAGMNGRDEADTKDWYTPKEAAEVVPRYKEATIRQACNLGRIPEARKISRQWYIPREAVERLANLGLPPLVE